MSDYIRSFSEFYNSNILKESYVKDLKEVGIRQYVGDMAEIERKNFTYYVSSQYDLLHDYNLEGYIGLGLFDDHERIVGYIYGNSLGADDEFDSLDEGDFDNAQFYDQGFKETLLQNGIENTLTPENTFYTANFVINKENRIGIGKLLPKFIEKVKAAGYTYMTFDGLQDTLRIYSGRRSSRLNTVGIKIMVEIDLGESKLTLMKIR